ncbi:MAG TPA: class I SAM-dependent methyltransferase [Chitinophagaceae bacterium]|nr:class I SAM-dependent methyltransferase [Chitinophagaceae bacterium]
MLTVLPFDTHVQEYEAWFSHHPFVFKSEVEAIRDLLPPHVKNLRGLEIAAGTGRFMAELGIQEGIEPSPNMRALALKRGLEVLSAEASHLPYKDVSFDYALMAFCISYFDDISAAFAEARRILKLDGFLLVGFIEKNSLIGKYYESIRDSNIFYKQANFYTAKSVRSLLKQAGFRKFTTVQTLFHPLSEINEFEPSKPGSDEGSFLVIKAYR